MKTGRIRHTNKRQGTTGPAAVVQERNLRVIAEQKCSCDAGLNSILRADTGKETSNEAEILCHSHREPSMGEEHQ